MTVHVVIPWRPGCPHRENAAPFVRWWWRQRHPDWVLTVGVWPVEHGPWRKGCAVRAAAIRPADDDVVVVADADVIPPGVGAAVAAITAGCPWAMPFRHVYRLTEAATPLVVSGRLPLPDSPPPPTTGIVSECYKGSPGGGVVVMRGDVFTDVPLDPRFAGYGQEDLSWSLALHLLAGAPMMGTAHLWHLWHPPQPRLRQGPTVSRGVGSDASLRLWQRYRAATTTALMRSLVDEARVAYVGLMGDTHAGAG